MLLSRFWYFVLAAACAIAFAAALLTQAAFNRQYDTDLNDQLRRDRLELDLMMRTHARSRIDAIAPIAAHPDVRSALSRASRRSERMTVPSDIRSSLEDKLRSLNRQLEAMSGDLLFAVDDQGYIIAQLGASDPPPGAGLGRFPLVERALAGYVRDDSWIYNGKVYGMAARPVIDSGQYVGAVVHGLELDEDLARKLGEPLNKATVAFFWNDRVLASYMPDGNAARADDVEGALAQVAQDEDFAVGRRSTPLDLEGGSRAIYQRLTGSAGQAGVGFSVARPRHTLASVWDVFDLITLDDVNALPGSVLGGLIGGSLLLFLLGMLWLWLERDRPFGRLKHASAALAKREVDRLTITDFGGGYRKIAQNVNDAMDKAVESAAAASPKRQAADLDEILGPTPGGAASSPQFFGFAGNQDAEADQDEDFPDDIPSIPPAGGRGGPPPKPAGGPPPKPAGAPPPPGPSAFGAPTSGAYKPPPPAAPAAKAPPPPAPKTPPPLGGAAAGGPGVAGANPAPATPGVDDKPDWQKGTLLGVGAAESNGGSGPVQAPPASKAATPAQPPPAEEDDFADDEDGVTMVAEVPKELLNQAASQGKGGGDADEQHFREVFDKFVATKKDCGEPTAGLTFDKFVQTLRKNRDQIVQRHGAKTVRFTVYQKDGKAALKATPVKD